ncbi:putative transposase IS891/IS1136/IS1341 family protein [Microseira wollei NIES-4236]|uniref:Transposase IS891/IS1136/IS1341 family protein n=1 Tax=Microseira wollei NIES-4236 TaxID=2530354 RepID=A0AAV3XFQ4_9CYAN|nr:transposase [Microseira wollei]GET39536.1 putative transposase IS891/IS1136/IS1341 family protein [Microseira wollei NIES-4236]
MHTGLNRSMLDIGIGNLTKAIEYKLQESGGFLVKVPTKKVKPSQTCPNCGHQRKKDLSERVHLCSECGYTSDRDVAAALVMLSWALGTSGHGSWRGNPYFQSPTHGRLEANFLYEATETHCSALAAVGSS